MWDSQVASKHLQMWQWAQVSKDRWRMNQVCLMLLLIEIFWSRLYSDNTPCEVITQNKMQFFSLIYSNFTRNSICSCQTIRWNEFTLQVQKRKISKNNKTNCSSKDRMTTGYWRTAPLANFDEITEHITSWCMKVFGSEQINMKFTSNSLSYFRSVQL